MPDTPHEIDPSPSQPSTEMKIPIDASRAAQLLENLQSIQSRITTTLQNAQKSSSSSSKALARTPSNPPRLVAVSKLKPASDILALHQPANNESTSSSPGVQTHFGENYVQELLEKSRLLPRSIKWHFIGGLQSNKCAQLAREVPNLWAVESVDSVKKATLLNRGRGEVKQDPVKDSDKNSDSDSAPALRLFVQVNTSGEDSKSGVAPKSSELIELCKTIRGEECAHVQLAGLMTIGAIARSRETTAENENEDFVCLRENRDWVAEQLGIEATELELSMGMSEDFEGAIVQGSDEVRVGSTIFGTRPPKSEAKVLEHTEEEKK